MPRITILCAVSALLLAAHEASAQVPPVVLHQNRIRLEVQPQVVETNFGDERFAISVGVDDDGAVGAGMLTMADGTLHMRIIDGLVLCDDDGFSLALRAIAKRTPRVGRSRAETELLILISPRLDAAKPRGGGPAANDILIGGSGRDFAFTADGRLQIIGEVPCEE